MTRNENFSNKEFPGLPTFKKHGEGNIVFTSHNIVSIVCPNLGKASKILLPISTVFFTIGKCIGHLRPILIIYNDKL